MTLLVIGAIALMPMLAAGGTDFSVNGAGQGATVTLGRVAAAQEATPAASPEPGDPANCTVEPRPAEDFTKIPEEQPEMLGTPVATPLPPSGGTPADATVVAAVTHTVEQLVACFNAFDPLRLAALFTDAAFARLFTGPGADATEDVLEHLLQPRPLPPDQRVHLVSVTDVRVLADGRVTAVVQTSEATQLVLFAPEDDDYLIDWYYELPGAGTPVAPVP